MRSGLHHVISAQVGAQVGAHEGEEEAGTAARQVTGRQGAVLHRRRRRHLESGQRSPVKQSNNTQEEKLPKPFRPEENLLPATGGFSDAAAHR